MTITENTEPSTTTTTTITIAMDIPNIACESIMSTAIEGGIGYWATARNITYAHPNLLSPRASAVGSLGNEDRTLYWSYEVCDREELEDANGDEIEEENDDKVTWHKVDYDVVRRGLERMFSPKRVVGGGCATARNNFLTDYGDWIQDYCDHTGKPRYPLAEQIFGGTMDADDVDVIVQLGIFDDVVYS